MLDAAMKIVGSNLKSLVPMAAGLVLPFQILIALVAVNTASKLVVVTEGSATLRLKGPTAGQWGVLGGTILLTFLATLVVTGALTWFVAEYYVGRKPTAGESIRYALRRLPKLVLFSLAQVLPFALLSGVVLFLALTVKGSISLIMFVILIPVAMWLYISLSMTVPVLVIERLGVWAGMKRSVDLVKQYWWKVFGTLIVTGILVGIFSAVVQNVVQSLLNSLGGNNKGFEFVWIAIAGTLATALTTPISAAMSTLLYADLRIRKEGFDLEVLSAAMANPSSPSSSAGQL
jgi:hypothetical protein